MSTDCVNPEWKLIYGDWNQVTAGGGIEGTGKLFVGREWKFTSTYHGWWFHGSFKTNLNDYLKSVHCFQQ